MNIWLNGADPVSRQELAARIAKQLDVKVQHFVAHTELDAEHSVIDTHPYISWCAHFAANPSTPYNWPNDIPLLSELPRDRNNLYVYLLGLNKPKGIAEAQIKNLERAYWRLWFSELHTDTKTIGVQAFYRCIEIGDNTEDRFRVIPLHPDKGEEFQQIADEVVQIVRRLDQAKQVLRANDLNP